MSSLGSYLRDLRARRGVSLDEIARLTRVPLVCLQALEADDYAALPDPVFTKGFIRAYCQVLDEAPDEALTRYLSRPGGPGVPVAGAPVQAPMRRGRGRGAVLVSLILVVVLGAALLALTIVLEPGREPGGQRRIAVAPSAPPAGDTSADRSTAATGSPSSPPTPEAGTTSGGEVTPAAPGPPASASTRPAPTPPLPPSTVTAPYRLVARAKEATWVRIRAGEGPTKEETIPAGAVREWVSDRPFVIAIGNAGGITLELNGRTLPALGKQGTVISRLVLPPDSP